MKARNINLKADLESAGEKQEHSHSLAAAFPLTLGGF